MRNRFEIAFTFMPCKCNSTIAVLSVSLNGRPGQYGLPYTFRPWPENKSFHHVHRGYLKLLNNDVLTDVKEIRQIWRFQHSDLTITFIFDLPHK
jgi:hypothetical protein